MVSDTPRVNSKLIQILALLSGTLTSCDRKEPSSLREVKDHFNQVSEKEENARTKIKEHFKDTDYRFEISNVAVSGMPPEGKVKGEDLTALKFTLMIWVEGAGTIAKAEEVDYGLREIFTSKEVEEMTIYYQTGMEGESRIVSTLESMRRTEKFWKEQGGQPPVNQPTE